MNIFNDCNINKSDLRCNKDPMLFDLMDFSDFLKQVCLKLKSELYQAGFKFKYDISRESGYAFTLINKPRMNRVFNILAHNTKAHNPIGTKVYIKLSVKPEGIHICFKDNGIGISSKLADSITKSLGSADMLRNINNCAAVMDLDAVFRIIRDHGGSLTLLSDINKGCSYRMFFPAY